VCVVCLQVIKDYQLFMVVGILLMIDVAIMTTWQVTDPFYRETKQMESYVGFKNKICHHSSLLYIYHGADFFVISMRLVP
jgi:hypothetical protein